KVLKYDRERRRVSLGLKQLGADPWVDIARRYPEKTRMFGKVTNITDYGAFVEIEAGVEGLVHVSEMDWTNKNVNPNKVVHLGDEVEV
ncbi:S1 RNA-binding domain-containing protein, partial [Acinetobacter baumannii]